MATSTKRTEAMREFRVFYGCEDSDALYQQNVTAASAKDARRVFTDTNPARLTVAFRIVRVRREPTS